jgi:hypothetical protein
MTTKVITYIYDHAKYPAQIKFAVVGTNEFSIHDFDEEAENMLVNLFNEHANQWHLNTDWEDESLAENYDESGELSI